MPSVKNLSDSLPVSCAQVMPTPVDSARPAIGATKKRHLDNLDVLRGLAILGVMLFHSLDSVWFKSSFPYENGIRKVTGNFAQGTAFYLFPFHLGFLGVAMFFAVSGFCIHFSVQQSRNPVPGLDFFTKRFFRIVPAYYVVLLILAAQRVHWQDWESLKGLMLHLLFVHNLSNAHIYSLNPSFWSIAVEMQLYVLYPALWFLARKIGWGRTAALTLVIEMSLRLGAIWTKHISGNAAPVLLTGSPFYFWFSWAIGAYAAELHLKEKRLPNALSLGIALVLLGFVADCWEVSSEMSFTLVAAGTACLLLGQWNLPALIRKAPVLLGAWSYSLYLIHQPFLQKVGAVLGERFQISRGLTLICVLATAGLLVPIAGISYHLLEKPSIAFGHQLRAKLRFSTSDKS